MVSSSAENQSDGSEHAFLLKHEQAVRMNPGRDSELYAFSARTALPMTDNLVMGTNMITRIIYPSRNPEIHPQVDYMVPYDPGKKGNHYHHVDPVASFFTTQVSDYQIESDPAPDYMPAVHLNSIRYSVEEFRTFGTKATHEQFLGFANLPGLTNTYTSGILLSGEKYFRQFMVLDPVRNIAAEQIYSDSGDYDFLVIPMRLKTQVLLPGFNLITGITFALEVPVDVTGESMQYQLDRVDDVIKQLPEIKWFNDLQASSLGIPNINFVAGADTEIAFRG